MLSATSPLLDRLDVVLPDTLLPESLRAYLVLPSQWWPPIDIPHPSFVAALLNFIARGGLVGEVLLLLVLLYLVVCACRCCYCCCCVPSQAYRKLTDEEMAVDEPSRGSTPPHTPARALLFWREPYASMRHVNYKPYTLDSPPPPYADYSPPVTYWLSKAHAKEPMKYRVRSTEVGTVPRATWQLEMISGAR